MKKVTDRQLAVLRYFVTYSERHGYPPSTLDVQKHFRFRSTYSARAHVWALQRKGHLSATSGRKNSMRTTVVTQLGLHEVGACITIGERRCHRCNASHFRATRSFCSSCESELWRLGAGRLTETV